MSLIQRIALLLVCFVALAPTNALAQAGRWSEQGDRVLDRKTGLTWQRCAAGQHWDGRGCAGPQHRYTWDQAAALTSGGWRLPTPDELATLVDLDRKRRGLVPTLDVEAFPGMPAHGILDMWTAFRRDCPQNAPQGCAIVVTFGPPHASDLWDQPVSLPLPVRLVRGTTAAAGAPAAAPPSAPPRVTASGHFEISGETARDLRTGLVWQRCDAGQRMTVYGCGGVSHRFSLADALRSGKDGWRLPTLDELLTLVDKDRMSRGDAPYIDRDAFPTGPNDIDVYWTSKRYTTSGDELWCVNFHIGTADNCKDPQGVRLVR